MRRYSATYDSEQAATAHAAFSPAMTSSRVGDFASMNVMFTRHGLRAEVSQVNPHRFRHTFATWAIRVNARELDVQYLLGHSSPMMVRRYSATYDSEEAAKAHAAFSPAMQL